MVLSSDMNIYSESKPDSVITISFISAIGYNVNGFQGAILFGIGGIGGEYITNHFLNNDYLEPQQNNIWSQYR